MPFASIDDTYQRMVDDIHTAANADELNRLRNAYGYFWLAAPQRWLSVLEREFKRRMTALSAN